LIVAEILAIQVKQVEGKEAGFTAAEEKIVESWAAFLVDADNFPIKNRSRPFD
jgi:hypothetical protein